MALEEQNCAYQLQELGDHHDTPEGNTASAMPPLPPADGGRAAWLFLFGSFMIETLTWGELVIVHGVPISHISQMLGFPYSFGVLKDYYTNNTPISSHPHGISAVGTTCSVSLALTLNKPR